MKKVYLCVVALAVGAGVAQAERTAKDILWDLQETMNRSWSGGVVFHHPPHGGKSCGELLEELDEVGAPESATIRFLTSTPDWKGGEHPLSEVRPICARWMRTAALEAWHPSLNLAIGESQKIGTSAYYDTAMFNLCLVHYEKMLQMGIQPTDPIPPWKARLADGSTITLSGTVEEVRKQYCDVGMAKVKEEMEAKFAPYRKALKNDKLSMVVIEGANSARAYILPGGKVSTDPKQLAAASVWFSDTTTSDRVACKGKDQHVVHRYQFDKNHKLVKTTDKTYCGSVPARAYK
jgi:hypothetical protein